MLDPQATSAQIEFARRPDPGVALFVGTWLVGSSPAIVRLRAQVAAIGEPGTLVIQGEPGSGRHQLAQALHRRSSRTGRGWQELDARRAATATALRELASSDREVPGSVAIRHLERAHPDVEVVVAGLDPRERPDTAIAWILEQPLDVLRKEQAELAMAVGRTASTVLRVPPLRSRIDDVETLATDILAQRPEPLTLDEDALELLRTYPYPGNCRELEALLEVARWRSQGGRIRRIDLPLAETDIPCHDRAALPGGPTDATLHAAEIAAIERALADAGGRLVRAAEILGITRHALRRKLDKHGLHGRSESADTGVFDEDACI